MNEENILAYPKIGKHGISVMVGDESVKFFSFLEDDYAHTNAYRYVEQINKQNKATLESLENEV